MRSSAWVRGVCALSALALLAAACGGDDGDTETTSTTTMKPPSGDMADAEGMADADETADDDGDMAGTDDTADDAEEMTDADEAADDEMMSADLSGVCPSPLIIQTDWFPESEHGAMYQMVGADYSVDAGNQITAGSLMAGGADTGIDIEIRAGGPAIGTLDVL